MFHIDQRFFIKFTLGLIIGFLGLKLGPKLFSFILSLIKKPKPTPTPIPQLKTKPSYYLCLEMKKLEEYLMNKVATNLSPSIKEIEEKLLDKIVQLTSSEKWDLDASPQVLQSANDLLIYLMKIFESCQEKHKMNNGQPLYELHLVFNNIIHMYYKIIRENWPERKIDLSTQEKNAIQIIARTAEFLSSVCERFERKFKAEILPEFQSKISFEHTRYSFGLDLLYI